MTVLINNGWRATAYLVKTSEKKDAHLKEFLTAGGEVVALDDDLEFVKLDEAGNIVVDDGSNNYTTAPLGKLVMLNPAYTY